MNVISRYYQIQQHFAASEQDKRAVQRPIYEETSRMAGDPPNGLPRKPPLACALGQLLVLRGGQQIGRQRYLPVAVRGDADPEHPAGRVGLGVDQRGVVLELAVDLDHHAVHRGVQVAHGLDRLHLATGLAGGHARASGRQRQEDHVAELLGRDRKSTRLNSSHVEISYAVFCLKKKKKKNIISFLYKKKKKKTKK